ncbi:hypothetical protein ABQY37_21470 [Xanthomonas hortorum]|uniref:tetratricopeptide repeat protein n=1 Tax=Xanthomonas hortorum TaxID=56454 RepID=UPI0032E8A87F
MDNKERLQRLVAAKKNIEVGDYGVASNDIAPLVIQEDPEAMFLSSTFSASAEESDSDFEARSFKLLLRAAELRFAPAMYALAVCYATGDLVDQSESEAARWYEAAAKAGHQSAKLHYGIALFNGAGVAIDHPAGLALIREVASMGDPTAAEVLADLEKQRD